MRGERGGRVVSNRIRSQPLRIPRAATCNFLTVFRYIDVEFVRTT